MLKRVLHYFVPHKKRILAIFVVSILVSLFSLSDAWLMGRMTDAIFYHTKGMAVTINVSINQTKDYNLDLVKTTPWSANQVDLMKKDINEHGFTTKSAGSPGNNSIVVGVQAPQNIAKDPLRMLSILQNDLKKHFSGIHVYISGEVRTIQKGFRLFPQYYTIFILPFFVIVFYFLRGIFTYTQNYLIGSVGQKTIRRLRNEIYENLQNLSISYFERNKTGQTGQIISRILNDIDSINYLFTSGIINIALQPLMVVIGLAWGFYINWKLTLMFGLVIPFMAIPVSSLTKKLKVVNVQIMNKSADITDVLEETLSGIKVVKAFGMEKYE
ncbi:MAG TPA: hypothetical protein DDW50_19155, partial [Firmicutes bacterium]|nr:hypothetical protein [Bacillota bacterium]